MTTEQQPWLSEPDEWDAECVHAHRHGTTGTWVGYVGVGKQHPLYGVGYMRVALEGGGVHGGLTYSGEAYWETQQSDLWWFGFDCAHSGDYLPAIRFAEFNDNDSDYRTLAFVQQECLRLAQQLAKWQWRVSPNQSEYDGGELHDYHDYDEEMAG